MGLIPILTLLKAYVEWERISDIYHTFGHMLLRLSSLLANSTLVNELYVLGIVLPYDFRIFLHVIQLAHTGPLNAQDSEDKAL